MTAVATALDERKTVDGLEIDSIIAAAEAKVEHETEIRRREAMADMAARAPDFNTGRERNENLLP